MKKPAQFLALLLTLALCVGLVPVVTLSATAAPSAGPDYIDNPYDYSTHEGQLALERMVQETALAYFYKGSAIQYDSYYLSAGGRYKSSILRQTMSRAPEDASDLNPIYTVCSAFPHDVYYNIFGKHIITNSLARPSSQLPNARVNMAGLDENDESILYETSILNVTMEYTYHGAMAKAAGYDVGDPHRSTDAATQASQGDYADVLFYFGPDLDANGVTVMEANLNGAAAFYELKNGAMSVVSAVNANAMTAAGTALKTADQSCLTVLNSDTGVIKNFTTSGEDEDGNPIVTGKYYAVAQRDDSSGNTVYTYVKDVAGEYTVSGRNNTISAVTQADVEYLFNEVLRPGDILVSRPAGDPTADATDSGHAMMYLGDIDGDGVGEIIHSTGAKYNNNASSAATSHKKYVTQKTFDTATSQDVNGSMALTYGSKPAYVSSNNTSAAQTGTYLNGYDIWEQAYGMYYENANNLNNYSGPSAAFAGRNGGGSIAVEDWNSRLGYRMKFTGNTNATAGSPKIDTTAGYGSGFFLYNYSYGRSAPHYFGNNSDHATLSPFQFTVLRPLAKTSMTGRISPNAQARDDLRDLIVTKEASPNPYQAVSSGDTITYTVTLTNNKPTNDTLSNPGVQTTTTPIGFWRASQSNNPDYRTRLDHDNSYTDLSLSETIPAGTTLAATPEGAAVSGDTITWSGLTVAEGEVKTLTYTVTAPSDLGIVVTSPNGRVWKGSAGTAYLTTGKLSHLVGGTPVAAANGSLSAGTGHPGGSGMDVVTTVYDEVVGSGTTLLLPSAEKLIAALFDTDVWTNESTGNAEKFRFRDPGELEGDSLTLRNMVIPNYVGGRKVMTYQNGRKSNENRLLTFSEEFLFPGDILVYANQGATGFATDSKIYVYLGNSNYASCDGGAYTVTSAPLKLVQTYNKNTRFLYSSVLTQAFLYDYFVALRPSQVTENIRDGGTYDYTDVPDLPVAATVQKDSEAPVGYRTLKLALQSQRMAFQEWYDAYRGGSYPNIAEWGGLVPSWTVTLLRDEDMRSSEWTYGSGVIDLGGHTLTFHGKSHLNFYEAGGNSGGGGNCTLRNGVVNGTYTAVYAGNTAANVLNLENVTLLGGNMGGQYYQPGSLKFYGFGLAKAAATINLTNCVIGTACVEMPVYGSASSIMIRDNVTFLVPVGASTSHSGGWSTTASMSLGSGVSKYTRTAKWNTALNEANGGTNRNYTVITYTTSPAVSGKATLSDAIADATAGGTVTLVRDVDLTRRTEVGNGAYVPGLPAFNKYFTLAGNGHKITGDLAISGGTVTLDGVRIDSESTPALTVNGGSVTLNGTSVLYSGTALPLAVEGGTVAARSVKLATDKPDAVSGSLYTGTMDTSLCRLVSSDNAEWDEGTVAHLDFYTGESVATVGETSYLSLAAAVAAAESGEIKTVALTGNATLTEDLTIPAGVTLTTGAYTINGMGNVYVMPGGSYGTVTVPDFSGVAGDWVRDTGYLAAPSLWSTGRQTLTLLDGIVVNAAIPVQADTTYYIWLDGAESAIPASLQSGNACFDLKDCYAFEMTAQVPAILLAVKGETTSISPVHSFSVKGYADSALSRVNWESEDGVGYTLGAKLGRALTAMLDYGALAQTYFEENTETLANADVPAAARTSLSDTYTMSRLNENRDSAPVTATGSDPSVYYGASCVLGRKLDMKFYFRLASTAGITGVAAYTDHEGKTVEQPITASDLTKNETGDFYSYKVTGLNAADVCSGVTVTLRRGGADLVTVTDSIANYTARIYQERISATDPKEIAVRDLANAMMTYGLSAADYLEGHAAPGGYTPEPGETSIG